MKFSIKNFFSKCDQIPSFLRIWSHLLKKSLTENFIFWAVLWIKEQRRSEKSHFMKLTGFCAAEALTKKTLWVDL